MINLSIFLIENSNVLSLADTALSVLVFLSGLIIVVGTLISLTQTYVLARSARDPMAALVFASIRWLFNARASKASTYEERDRIMALYAPTLLLTLPMVWLTCITLGYMLMFWGVGVRPLGQAFAVSGSSLLTLGFVTVEDFPRLVLEFTEAAIGLLLIALLIAYLPTMYAAFSRRERDVTLLETYAGSPPTASQFIQRVNRIHGLDYMEQIWRDWQIWFADIEESHTSFGALVFFRSTRPDRSWITAAGALLDAAAIRTSTLDLPNSPAANLCLRSGYLALRYIGDYYGIQYDPDPRPSDPVSINRREFDAVYDELVAAGVPVKPDRDQCWKDFRGWRVNYDVVLLELARLTLAPYAPWSSDRSPLYRGLPPPRSRLRHAVLTFFNRDS